MAIPFSNTKLRPPQGFRNILNGLSREVLRSQPGDIYAFGTLYLEKLLQLRHESGFDPASVGASFEDIYYNKVFKVAGEQLAKEHVAALKIQAAYRQHRAKSVVIALRQDKAAVKIQAGFQGFMARKKVKQMREELLSERDKSRHLADVEDAEDLDKDTEFPATTDYQDVSDNPDEPSVPLEEPFSVVPIITDEMQEAATRIQAGFKGMLARQALREDRGEEEESDDGPPADHDYTDRPLSPQPEDVPDDGEDVAEEEENDAVEEGTDE